MKHYTPHHVVEVSACAFPSQNIESQEGKKKSQFGYFQDISPLVVHALPDSSIGSLEGAAICANLFGLISNCMGI